MIAVAVQPVIALNSRVFLHDTIRPDIFNCFTGFFVGESASRKGIKIILDRADQGIFEIT